MSTLRELKGRVGSVASAGKISSAMKMISSAKMHKAEQNLKKLMPFRCLLESMASRLLTADCALSFPLLAERKVRRVGVVALGSDDGLCGSYNVNIFKSLLDQLTAYRQTYGDSVEVEIYPVGKKLEHAVRKIAQDRALIKALEGVHAHSSNAEIGAFVEDLKRSFLGGAIDKVDVVYMHFKSISKQVLTCEQLLPMSKETWSSGTTERASDGLCLFEPNAEIIFGRVLPMLVNSTMHKVFVENVASENAARMIAMQSASDNANKLLDSLQLEYNKIRQQRITTELLEILGGQTIE